MSGLRSAMAGSADRHDGPLRGVLLFAGIVLAGANLRASITSVGPVIGAIQESTGISGSLAGLLTTLPLLAFAALSPVAPGLADRFGLARVLFGGLILLTGGILLRSVPQVPTLFLGTVALGVAIAAGNVLLPGLVKRHFPEHVGPVTGAYVTAMNVGAALAAGLSAPLAYAAGLGWQGALGVWAGLSLLAVLVWVFLLGDRRDAAAFVDAPRFLSGPWRSPLAWQVTLFMGLQSVVFYVSITWLPAILRDHGLSPVEAGWMVAVMQIVSIPAALFVPVFAARQPSQSGFAAAAALLCGAGALGLMLFDGMASAIPVVLLGLGQGSSISLALTLFMLRAQDAHGAAELSGMAQTVGYLLAAAGPPLFGFLHDLTLGWTIPLAAMSVVTVALLLVGLGAGRDARVASPAQRARAG